MAEGKGEGMYILGGRSTSMDWEGSLVGDVVEGEGGKACSYYR